MLLHSRQVLAETGLQRSPGEGNEGCPALSSEEELRCQKKKGTDEGKKIASLSGTKSFLRLFLATCNVVVCVLRNRLENKPKKNIKMSASSSSKSRKRAAAADTAEVKAAAQAAYRESVAIAATLPPPWDIPPEQLMGDERLKPQLDTFQALEKQHKEQLEHADSLFQYELQLAHTDVKLDKTERFLQARAKLFHDQQVIQAELLLQLLAEVATLHDDDLIATIEVDAPAEPESEPVFEFIQQWEGYFGTARDVGFTLEYDGLSVVYPNVRVKDRRDLEDEVLEAKRDLTSKVLDRALERFASGEVRFRYAPFLQAIGSRGVPTVAQALQKYHKQSTSKSASGDDSDSDSSRIFQALERAIVTDECPCRGLVHVLAQTCHTIDTLFLDDADNTLEARRTFEKKLADTTDLFNINLFVMALMEDVVDLGQGAHIAFKGFNHFNSKLADQYTTSKAVQARERNEQDHLHDPNLEPMRAFDLTYNVTHWPRV
jgi:hypothetical protein